MLPQRFGTFIKILAISALSFSLPVMAQEQNRWQFGSLRANSSVSKPDAQQVYEVMLKMLDRWNAHDIEGHLEPLRRHYPTTKIGKIINCYSCRTITGQ